MWNAFPMTFRDRLHRISPFFRLAHSAATLNSYWANHCEHCGTLLGDHELHCEPDGAFMPSSEAAAANIQLQQVPEALRSGGGGLRVRARVLRLHAQELIAMAVYYLNVKTFGRAGGSSAGERRLPTVPANASAIETHGQDL